MLVSLCVDLKMGVGGLPNTNSNGAYFVDECRLLFILKAASGRAASQSSLVCSSDIKTANFVSSD